jgi:pimeloyl-ACP methyl ester carboxylesterase
MSILRPRTVRILHNQPGKPTPADTFRRVRVGLSRISVKKRIVLALFLVILVTIVVLPIVRDLERQELNAETRAQAPGRFVKLADGWVHYDTAGPADGPLVVLVHGFNGPMTTWNHTFAPLVRAGYRVLAYDLFGRGFSDRPDARYDLDFFDRQLEQLLAAVGANEEPLLLIGSSFGSVIASEFAVRRPTAVAGLILVGPAGFPSPNDESAGLLSIPLVSDYVFTTFGDQQLIDATRKYYVEPDRYPEAHASFREHLSFEGTKRAALATLQNSPLRDYSAGWNRVGRLDRPVLLVWGRQDVSFPYENHTAALRMMPQARLTTIEKAAHLPQYEQPKVVNRAILDFANEAMERQ